jgi:two-component system chemotaxis response regulator CheY
MVTSETEMSQMAKALDAGANEYVTKPFTKNVIVDKLALLGLTP